MDDNDSSSTPPALEGSRNISKVRETLERIRRSKANIEDEDSSEPVVRASNEAALGDVSPASKSESRRRDLLRMRAQFRGDQSNEDLDAVQKSQSDRRRRISRKDNPEVLVDEDDSEEDSENEVSESGADRTETSRLIEEQEPEIYGNLTNISQSYYIYPTTMLPRSRAAETAMQPLLYIAEPFPSVRSICRQQSSCCDGGMLKQGQRRNELDLITGDIEMGVNDMKGSGLANSEMDSLLNRLDNDKTSRLNSTSPHYHERESQSKCQNVHRQDGLYSSHLPIFARILMSAENVDSLPIAKLVESNIGLARVTQRTLRELDGGVENERLRRQWISMSSTVSNGNSRRVSKGGGEENSARRGETSKHDDVLYYNRIAASGRSVSSVHQLLHQLSVGPVLRLIDDPVIDLPCQPVIPEPSVAYGGRLGCWSEHSSNAERLGHLAVGGEDKRGSIRSLLRVHIHRLNVLEHPYVCEEERIFANLREIFSQYSTLIQQNNLEYFCGRVMGLIEEINRLITLSDEITLEAQEMQCVRVLYRDLAESLLCLHETRCAIGSLTATLYATWRTIQEVRRKQGFSSTTACLTVRKVCKGYEEGNVDGEIGDDISNERGEYESGRRRRDRRGRDRGRDNDRDRENTTPSKRSNNRTKDGKKKEESDNEENGSNKFRTFLDSLPDILDKVQDLFLRDAAAKSELKNQELQDQTASSSSSVVSGNDTTKHKNSHMIARGSVILGDGESTVPAPVPLGELDEFNVYIADSMPSVLECIRELLRVNPGPRGDDADTPGSGRYSLSPEYVIRVSEEGQITANTFLNATELYRRRLLNELRYKFVLVVNGKAVTHSEYVELRHPSLIAEINQYFDLRLVYEPTDLAIDIIAVNIGSLSCFKKETFLARVALPIPGQSLNGGQRDGRGRVQQSSAHSYAPKMGWYTYCTDKPVVVVASSSYVPQRSTGALLCTVEYDVAVPDRTTPYTSSTSSHHQKRNHYDGINSEELGLLPLPSSGPDFFAISDVRKGDFARERDFQALLPHQDTLDLNDPRNEHLLYLKSRGPVIKDRDVFLLSGLDFAVSFKEDGVPYSNFVALSQPLRMRLLMLRDLKPHLFTVPIPLSTEEIKHSDLYRSILASQSNTYSAGLATSAPLYSTEDTPTDDYDPEALTLQHEASKTKIAEFLERVRNSHTALTRQHRRKKFFTSSAVAETDYFHMDEWDDIELLPPRKRALRPKAKVRTAQSMEVSKCDLLIQIVGARNVPLRAEIDEEQFTSSGGLSAVKRKGVRSSHDRSQERDQVEGEERDQDTPGVGTSTERALNRPLITGELLDATKVREKMRARTFVEVRFQEGVCATTGMEGGSPLWKQSLSLPFRPPQGDYTPDGLSRVHDVIVFTLFDEIIEDDIALGGLLEGEASERIERRYIGSFSIPFSTVFKEGRIDGIFRLVTPVFNFGYDHTQQIVRRNIRGKGSRIFVPKEGDVDEPETVVPGLGSLLYRLMASYMYTPEVLAEEERVRRRKKSNEAKENGLLIHHSTQNELDYFASGSSSTYLKLMITLDPMLPIPPTTPEEISGAALMPEDRFLAAHARSWLSHLAMVGTHTKNRPYKLFGMNSSGLNTFLPRYLTAQRPPKGFESRRACVHLTSIVPFMQDSQAFIGDLDLWCTTKQLLDIGAGDEEEHAVMLYNMLYHLALKESGAFGRDDSDTPRSQNQTQTQGQGRGQDEEDAPIRGRREGRVHSTPGKKASHTVGYPSDSYIRDETVFLALGDAVPEGRTVYVLIKDTRKQGMSSSLCSAESYLIINPSTGHMYSAGDSSCPLRSILVLVTPYNLWANIQVDASPRMTLYDILNVDHWRPFFGARLPPPTGGLQSVQAKVTYVETRASYCLEVEKTTLQAIKDSMRRWRSKRHRSTTTFHPDACAALYDLLPLLEDWKRTGDLPTSPNVPNDLEDRDIDEPRSRGRSRGRSRDRDSDNDRDNDRDRDRERDRSREVGGDAGKAFRSDNESNSQTEVGEAVIAFQKLVRVRMKNILRTRSLKGCPINAPFRDLEGVLDQIKTLCVHQAKHPDVQFVVAVRAFPAINGIISLWIFLGQLETKSTEY